MTVPTEEHVAWISAFIQFLRKNGYTSDVLTEQEGESVSWPKPADDVYLLRLPEVKRRTGKSRSSIYQDMARGLFPKPIKIGPRTSAWRSDEIAAHIEAATAASRGD